MATWVVYIGGRTGGKRWSPVNELVICPGERLATAEVTFPLAGDERIS
jgi:hypothetical protein